ncbi:Fic family protein [Stomatohabitans albus]|uniref:Fic family protein n=1 Tax=Stomatohabitans albus TaxID=3110766 RepID=UPI00300D1006
MEYQESHPWLTFDFKLNDLESIDLIHIGEAISKCEHVQWTPLAPAVAQELGKIFLAKGAHSTTSIEGNTLSEEEVRKSIEGELKLPRSQAYLDTEVKNVARVFQTIAQECATGTLPELSVERIHFFNSQILADLELEDHVSPGKFREGSAIVGNVYRGAPASDIDYLMDKFVTYINSLTAIDDERYKQPAAITAAILAHLYFVWIHPYYDGNGRTARLIEFQLLAQAGIPIISAHLLSDFYNRTREVYYRVLIDTSRMKNGQPVGPAPFLSYAVEGFVDNLRNQVDLIRGFLISVTWTNYIHEHFQGTPVSKIQRRRRQLILAMDPTKAYTKTEAIDINSDTVRAYANEDIRTITRDLNALTKMNLLTKEGNNYKPNITLLTQFFPIRHHSTE